jgi:hypothetical protein
MSIVAEDLPPVRVVLYGKYWDSQIYSGSLVLFGLDGSIVELDWTQFVASLPLSEELRLVAEAALLGSDRFYAPDMRRLIQDPEVKPVMVDKFRRLHNASKEWHFDISAQGTRIDNPMPFPHSDSDYYYGSLYVGGRSGVFRMIGDRKEQLADVPVLDIATKHSTVALAAGSQGLVEVQLFSSRPSTVSTITPEPCSVCEWSYSNVVCSDNSHSLFLATFARVRENVNDDPKRNYQYVRRFEGVLTDNVLFDSPLNNNAIQWGAKDRIYRYSAGEIETAYRRSTERASFGRMKPRRTAADFNLDQFVGVRVAPFGSVLEFDDRVAVLLNSGNISIFPGEPVNWRVFPRSLNYLNHLHLIYDDRIEIVAFTSDYFVAPGERLFGTEPVSADDDRTARASSTPRTRRH